LWGYKTNKEALLGGLITGTVDGITAGLVAGVTMKYTYDKLIHEQQNV
jgi:hypothetical protein